MVRSCGETTKAATTHGQVHIKMGQWDASQRLVHLEAVGQGCTHARKCAQNRVAETTVGCESDAKTQCISCV